MGDLDRGLPGGGLSVEGEEPVAPEGVHDDVDRLLVHVEGVEFTPGDAAPRVLAALSKGDQAQEGLFGGPSALLVRRFEDAFGSGGQGSRDPAELLVCGEGQSILVSTFEELREGVLQEREGAGLMGDIGDHLRHQPGLGPDADPFGGASDRLLELVGGERRNRLGPFSEQLSEPRVDERAVVEVCPEGHDDAEPALGVGGGDAKRLQEQSRSRSSVVRVKTSSN